MRQTTPTSSYGSAENAQDALAANGRQWLREGRIDLLVAACSTVQEQDLEKYPDVGHWRGACSLLTEAHDGIGSLEFAYLGHTAQGRHAEAFDDSCLALVLCLVDVGGMDNLTTWLTRFETFDGSHQVALDYRHFWQVLAIIVSEVVGEVAHPQFDAARRWLSEELRPLHLDLSVNERLIAGPILINACFAAQEFGHVELFDSLLGDQFLAQPGYPLLVARWQHMLGYAYYRLGSFAQAEAAWETASAFAEANRYAQTGQMVALAMLRLAIDRGSLSDAVRLESKIRRANSGARSSQIAQSLQMRSRLQLLQGTPDKALNTLLSAISLSKADGVSRAELGSKYTDLAQMFVANGKFEDAEVLLSESAAASTGRDAATFAALQGLLCGWMLRETDEAKSRVFIADALKRAQTARYSTFFRLLPDMAAGVCALALEWGIEPVFVREVIVARDLPAPAGAGLTWPWALWIQMLGPTSVTVRGAALTFKSKKPQRQPLHLLYAMGCDSSLSVERSKYATSVWSEALDPTHSLETTEYLLRQIVPDNGLLKVADGRVGLDQRRCRSDVVLRRNLVDQLKGLVMTLPVRALPSIVQPCMRIATRIADLTNGTLLDGFADAPWVPKQVERCELDRVRAITAIDAVLARLPSNSAEAYSFHSARDRLAGNYS